MTSSSFKKTSLVNFRLRTNQIKEEIKKLMESKLNQNRHVKVKNKVLENKNVKGNTTKLRKPNNLLFPKIGKFKGIEKNQISKPTSLDKTKKNKKKKKKSKQQKKKSVKKKKKGNDSPLSWDGPKPNCAWDGPGGCESSRARSQRGAEKGKKVVIEKSRFSNLFPKRSELNENEEFSRDENINVGSEKLFDKSKLLPGKTIKQRIEEHLRQREEDKRKQKKIDFASSVQQGISSSTPQPSKQQRSGRSKSSSAEAEGVQIYSVEEWLHMG